MAKHVIAPIRVLNSIVKHGWRTDSRKISKDIGMSTQAIINVSKYIYPAGLIKREVIVEMDYSHRFPQPRRVTWFSVTNTPKSREYVLKLLRRYYGQDDEDQTNENIEQND